MAKKFPLSATKIGEFKQCVYRCYMKYFLGIIDDKDSDPLRVGSNWHRCLEIASMKPLSVCPECSKKQNNPNCVICQGTDITPDDMLDAVIRELDQAYGDVPVYKSREEWLTERARLLYSIIAYRWYYQDDTYEVIAEELYFKIPLVNPSNGRNISGTVVTGKIDKIIRTAAGQVCVMEHKSTSSDLDPSSKYWAALGIDTQTTLYPWAFEKMVKAGDLNEVDLDGSPVKWEPFGIPEVLYDVWRKPQTSPKLLTQGDTKKFMEDGEYFDAEFEIKDNPITVDGEAVEVKPGAEEGAFAIRETPDMYGARLLHDITEDPARYFVRKPLARTAKDIARLENELIAILNNMKFLDKTDGWYHCERACEATYKCPYINYCYNNVDPTGNLLDGYKYTDWKLKEKNDGNNTAKEQQEQDDPGTTGLPPVPTASAEDSSE